EVQAGPGRGLFGRGEGADDRLGAGLGDVAHRLLFDGGQSAGDVALGGLRPEEVGTGALDDVDVGVVERLEPLADLVVDASFGDQVLTAGELGGLPEQDGAAGVDPAVHGLGRRRARAESAGRVGLAAL